MRNWTENDWNTDDPSFPKKESGRRHSPIPKVMDRRLIYKRRWDLVRDYRVERERGCDLHVYWDTQTSAVHIEYYVKRIAHLNESEPMKLRDETSLPFPQHFRLLFYLIPSIFFFLQNSQYSLYDTHRGRGSPHSFRLYRLGYSLHIYRHSVAIRICKDFGLAGNLYILFRLYHSPSWFTGKADERPSKQQEQTMEVEI